jgi:hypothetical protein
MKKRRDFLMKVMMKRYCEMHGLEIEDFTVGRRVFLTLGG